MSGPPGCGKSRTATYLAAELSDDVDTQVHVVDSWPVGQLDLPSQILRYASIPSGDDALLTLEDHSARLSRGLLVIIDGINSREHLHEVGRQLDAVLRQVTEPTIRFMLTIRTPPDPDLTAHPILSASIYEPNPRQRGVSFRTAPWRYEQARRVWDSLEDPGRVPFVDLPPSVQHLATTPLYLTLIHAAGLAASARPSNAFRLIDHCVQTILRRSGADTIFMIELLANLAVEQSEILPPPSLSSPALHHDSYASLPSDIPLLLVTFSAEPRFTHDIIREYFAAVRIADQLIEMGRSIASVRALNDLAEQAVASASARGIFEFVICRIDERDPQLASALALSPTLSVDVALPLLLRVPTATMSSLQVLQSCASRAKHAVGSELVRALLSAPSIASALGDAYSGWIITILRTFGQSIWADILAHLEQSLDADMATQLLMTADLERGEEATFFARHAALFHGISSEHWFQVLASHQDWRVRAALAEGLLNSANRQEHFTLSAIRRLMTDDDYKVRAAVARTVASAGFMLPDQVRALSTDPNWHVRVNLLRGLLDVWPDLENDPTSVNAMLSDKNLWRDAPSEAAILRYRSLLLLEGHSEADDPTAYERALFGLLREVRTGWIALPRKPLERLLDEGHRSESWLVRREVGALNPERLGCSPRDKDLGSMARREDFRRLRGRAAVQVALDVHSLDRSIAIAVAVAAAGVDFVEVGDPLIKQVGVQAIERVKRAVGATRVVAEMMSADWGRDQVEHAAEAGADIVLLIGPASVASVSAAVDAGRRLGTPIWLDVPSLTASRQWVRDMEQVGVDGFTVTSNIDIGDGAGHPLARARALRSWSRLPVAVSGGFSATDLGVISSPDWDVLIVGRSVTEAVQPGSAAENLLKTVRAQREGRESAH